MNAFVHPRRWMIAALWLIVGGPLGLPAFGQQLLSARSAVQPSQGLFAIRQFAAYHRYDSDPNRPAGSPDRDLEEFFAETVVAYGVTRDLAAMIHLPVVVRDFDDPAASPGALDDEAGLRDFTLMGQYRFWKRDTGPIDTQRAVLIAGLEIPTFEEGFSSDSFDPFVGLGYTAIRGRHGLGGGLQWKFNGGQRDRPVRFGDTEHDAGRVDLSYAYRVWPERYGQTSSFASFYLTGEALGRYETNGDTELLLAPGVLYEATRWAAGASVHLPVHQDLDGRPEMQFGLLLEFRVLF